ncbi:hypothetical protein [Streptomyces sp. NPDC102487]|uniref:hypothetical protein n=1 Tax=Streptomyces sp. NPDC102487 TaxID=3366182 RepID=UPI003824257D
MTAGPELPSMEALVEYLVEASLKTWSVDELAALINIRRDYIEKNLNKGRMLPHQRAGLSISFDATHIREIKRMHQVNPLDAEEAEDSGEPQSVPGPEREATPPALHLSLAGIRPSAGRHSRTG